MEMEILQRVNSNPLRGVRLGLKNNLFDKVYTQILEYKFNSGFFRQIRRSYIGGGVTSNTAPGSRSPGDPIETCHTMKNNSKTFSGSLIVICVRWCQHVIVSPGEFMSQYLHPV